MEKNPILKIEDLSKNFGGVAAVVRVSFQLEKGELLGIIGPNGSGKTTLVNLLTGFVRPGSGKVIYRGIDIEKFRGSAHDTQIRPIKMTSKGMEIDASKSLAPEVVAEFAREFPRP